MTGRAVANGALEFVPLGAVAVERLVELMNLEAVARHLPLLRGGFSIDDCRAFLADKQRLWDEHGYGPWAFLVDGAFAGWGGLQPERGEADFALVLHPDFWGWGRRIFNRVRDDAFGRLRLASITILLPPDRPNLKAVARFCFVEEGRVTIGEARFIRFRLSRPDGA